MFYVSRDGVTKLLFIDTLVLYVYLLTVHQHYSGYHCHARTIVIRLTLLLVFLVIT